MYFLSFTWLTMQISYTSSSVGVNPFLKKKNKGARRPPYLLPLVQHILVKDKVQRDIFTALPANVVSSPFSYRVLQIMATHRLVIQSISANVVSYELNVIRIQ